ncbi:uncharacterized protein LOC112554569 [Pomacea canaliculata]|uniref:uncharacterized protein LOC112554569 n=1 Tax=Pomacea canaliculata TaxID=400727 RepID=UPI000D72EA26|nr:uncharacterized protein LOC112554569 [Pomacea canaliculata]
MWGKDCKHQCNCAISTDECNRNNGTCDGHCDPRFRGAACQIQNMALQKPTRQSSLFYHDESQSLQYSFHAVDGNDDPSAGHCAVTQSLGESWWEVDLLSHVFINRITIVGQKYSTFTKMSLHIEVDGEVCFKRENSVRPSIQEDIFCTHNVIGTDRALHGPQRDYTVRGQNLGVH